MPESPDPKLHAHPQQEPAGQRPRPARDADGTVLRYAELHCLTNFSFLRGASHPEELVTRAAELGYAALAITDRNSLAGVVRAHLAAQEHNLHLLIGAEITPLDAPPVVLLAPDRAAYGRLARLITRGRLRTPKGQCAIYLQDLADLAAGLIAIVLPNDPSSSLKAAQRPARCHSEGAQRPRNDTRTPLEPGTPGAPPFQGWGTDPNAERLREPNRVPTSEEVGHPLRPSVPSSLHPSAPSSLRLSVTSCLRPSVPPSLRRSVASSLLTYRSIFADRLYLAAELAYDLPDDVRLAQLAELSTRTGIPLVAANNVHYHVPERRYLQDVLTCIRAQCTLAEAGQRLFANAERHLRPLDEIARRYAGYPDLLARTIEIAERCTFSLDELRYEYPHELVPEGRTAMEHLERLTWEGATERYGNRHGGTLARRHEGKVAAGASADCHSGGAPRPAGCHSEGAQRPRNLAPHLKPPQLCSQIPRFARNDTRTPLKPETQPMASLRPSVSPSLRDFVSSSLPPTIRQQLEAELALIAELKYEHYFLTVWDLVKFARRRGILCQGRGSAANSAVCYCLGITAVDPARIDLLFERFISRERNEPPDIDVDFEHERREEVFQYIYEKYGRERAGIAAEVITYRPRSAVRDVGKVLGLSLDRIDVLAKSLDWWDRQAVPEEVIHNAGLDPHDRTIQMLVRLVRQILGFPRHLSQHVGGFVITETPLCEIVPLENGAMPDRTFIEWDKDDIDALGILKVDCLALGMLTAINKCLALLQRHAGTEARSHKESDEATKRRSDEGNDNQGEHNESEDIPRPDRLAESHGTDQTGLQSNDQYAGHGEVRPDDPDAACRRFDPVQHRGRAWTGESHGLHSVPADGPRLADGIADAADPRPGAELHSDQRRVARVASRNRPRLAGPHPQPGKPPEINPPSLRRSVASSLIEPSIPQSLLHLPPEDPAVYDMICRADTVGVFQIESRAQMSMLPRLRPRRFYDLVIEVAIVRPGPIQGGMIHPYLRRRHGLEPVTYPSEAVKQVLHKTLGVPIFQEQVMRLAVVAAGFTPGEADQLRRAMAAWRLSGSIEKFQLKLIRGMLANGYSKQFAEQIYLQIRGFGEYGFPESHAASFALLVYASAWLKRYHPAAFCAAMLNAQPLGFYTPGQLIRDAIAHGVRVLPVDVNFSEYDCTLENRHAGIQARRYEDSDGATKRRSNEENVPAGPRTSHTQSEPRPSGSGPSVAAGAPYEVAAGAPAGRRIRCASATADDADVPTWGINGPALRLGLRLIRGLSAEKVRGIIAARRAGSLKSIRQLARRPDVSRETLVRLAAADAFRSLGLNRRQALWHVLALDDTEPPLFAELQPDEPPIALPPMPLNETVVHDYDALGFSLNAHPIGLVRREMNTINLSASDEENVAAGPRTGREENVAAGAPHDVAAGAPAGRRSPNTPTHKNVAARPPARPLRVSRARDLKHMRHGQRVAIAGLVTVRQRPGTAKGLVFMTLEDETGMANLVIRPNIWKRDRRIARGKIALIAEGHVERQGDVIHVQVRRFHDLSQRLANLRHRSRDFH